MKDIYRKAINLCKFFKDNPDYSNTDRDVKFHCYRIPTIFGPAYSHRIDIDGGHKINTVGNPFTGASLFISFQSVKPHITILSNDYRNNAEEIFFDEQCENLIDEIYNILLV